MYQTLNPQQTRHVLMVRHGWLDPRFELTDERAVYGEMRYNFLSRRTASAFAANRRWTITMPLFVLNSMEITDDSGAVIGEARRRPFARQTELRMSNGFTAIFYRPSLFSREWLWESPSQGTILRMYANPLAFKDEFEIASGIIPAETITLLIFLSTHLHILYRRRRAIR